MNRTKPSVCFIGTSSDFSRSALNTLCAQGVHISQIILAGHAPASPPAHSLPVDSGNSKQKAHNYILQLAQHRRLPLSFLGLPREHTQRWRHICNGPSPDFIFMACFPEKLPSLVLHWPRRYCINLHPSLLPRYRGPDPVYWQLRHGETHTGVSLHMVSKDWDAGPIVHQQGMPFPPQASRRELDVLLAQEGALAFARCLATDSFSATVQDERLATYQPRPGLDGEAARKSL